MIKHSPHSQFRYSLLAPNDSISSCPTTTPLPPPSPSTPSTLPLATASVPFQQPALERLPLFAPHTQLSHTHAGREAGRQTSRLTRIRTHPVFSEAVSFCPLTPPPPPSNAQSTEFAVENRVGGGQVGAPSQTSGYARVSTERNSEVARAHTRMHARAVLSSVEL